MTTAPMPIRSLLAAGYSYTEVARLARSGALVRVRRGSDVSASADLDEAARHRLLVAATVPDLAPDAVVSHASAAVLHGLTLLHGPTAVQVTRSSVRAGKRRGYLHLHAAPLPPEEVVTVRGLRCTSLARTVTDLARTLPEGAAVVVGDSALRQGLTRDDLQTVLAGSSRRPGVAGARRAIALLDARSESAGESLSRVALHRAGVPAPTPQLEVRDGSGRLVGRCDFGWEEHRTVGEFDGRIKYGRLLRPGQRPEDVLWAEKQREDALRDLGWQVVRWIWADLERPELLARRLARAFARSA